MKKIRLLIFAFWLTAMMSANALAGDYAELKILGFSQDGKFLAFAEYGAFDSTGGEYETTYYIDVVKNTFAAAPTVYEWNYNKSERSNSAILSRRKKSVAANLRKFRIVKGNTGWQTVAHLLSDMSFVKPVEREHYFYKAGKNEPVDKLVTDYEGAFIRRGIVDDAETLAPLAIVIFNDAFAANPLNKPEDMRAYIAEAFSLEQTKRELADERLIFFIAEIGGEMIGYAKLQEHSIESCVADNDPIELSRLYVLKEFHGRGIAEKLMNECFEIAREKNYQTMWLGVWEHNHRARRFYEKLGFKRVGEHIFQLGSDAQTDSVMEKRI